MTPDQLRWAEALQIEKMHGDGAYVFVAERVAALALEGDMDGVGRFTEIAARLNELLASRKQAAN